MAKKFIIELIDIPYHALPNISNIDVQATAERIKARRKGGGGNKNYDLNVAQISDMVTGLAELPRLKDQFAQIDDVAWREQTQDVCERLFGIFASEPARWYPVSRKPQELHDRTLFKQAIRGIWAGNGRALATLLNLRKTLLFDEAALAFLARGLHDFYLIDDPNLHGFNIVDLGADSKSGERATRVYSDRDVQMMSLEKFENVLRKFMLAVEMAGFSSRPAPGQSIADMFRPHR
jgi:hypothetical protein